MNWLKKLLFGADDTQEPEANGAPLGPELITRDYQKQRAEHLAENVERRVAALEVVFDEQSRETEQRTTEMARRIAALEAEFAVQTREREGT